MTKFRKLVIALLVLGAIPCLAEPWNGVDTLSPQTPATGVDSALVTAPSLQYYFWEPRVIHWKAKTPPRLRAVVSGTPSEVSFLPIDGSPKIFLNLVAPDTYEAAIPVDVILHGYKRGWLHNITGHILLGDGTQVSSAGRVGVNIQDQGVSDIPITSLAADAQAGPHVVNIRSDQLWLPTGTVPSSTFLIRFYQYFGDDYDFIALVNSVHAPGINPAGIAVSNNVSGIGMDLFDDSASQGSSGRLQAVLYFPIPTRFDLATHVTLHEMGHRWINWLDEVPFLGSGHWPISTLAYGIMGYSSPLSGAGLRFPYSLIDLGNGDYELRLIDPADEYNDFELYLMGLLDRSLVAESAIVFVDQNQRPTSGGILMGPVVEVSTQDIVNRVGPRVPPPGTQTEFRLASIVISINRLLTPDELAFYDHMAARGEARKPLPFKDGFTEGRTKPFYLATRRLGTLITEIP